MWNVTPAMLLVFLKDLCAMFPWKYRNKWRWAVHRGQILLLISLLLKLSTLTSFHGMWSMVSDFRGVWSNNASPINSRYTKHMFHLAILVIRDITHLPYTDFLYMDDTGFGGLQGFGDLAFFFLFSFLIWFFKLSIDSPFFVRLFPMSFTSMV